MVGPRGELLPGWRFAQPCAKAPPPKPGIPKSSILPFPYLPLHPNSFNVTFGFRRSPLSALVRFAIRNKIVLQDGMVLMVLSLFLAFVTLGFMDNTVMIQAGNAIDCSIGVVLGLSTLAAAAIGQIISSGVSVTFGGYVETVARKAGLPSAGFTSAQRQLVSVRRVAMAGNLFGVVIGAALGLVNLLLIDTDRSANLKMEALTEEQEFAFEVEASNKKRNDATVLTVKGPDVDGLIASMTAALAESGLKLVELHAGSRSSETDWIEDVFVVKTRGAKKGQVDDADLDDLARKMLAASRDPLSAHTLKTQVRKLQAKNDRLRERVEKLVKRLEDQQITIEIDTWEQEGHDDEN